MFTPVSFQFFLFETKKVSYGTSHPLFYPLFPAKTRIEFSPAIKKNARNKFYKKGFYGIKKIILEYILWVAVAKRGDFKIPTKSAFTLFCSW